jgi:hypothetical protein
MVNNDACCQQGRVTDRAPYTLTNEERRLVEAYRQIKDEPARNGFLAVAELAARK